MLFGKKILENCHIDKGLLPAYYKKVICNFDGMSLEYSIDELIRLTDVFGYKISDFLPAETKIDVVYDKSCIFVNCI